MRERDQTHSYWYIPSAPRVNYSLLVMESAGMIKMAIGDDPPSGRVPEQGPDWFLVAIEACGGETPYVGSVLEVWGYIRGVGVGNKLGGSPSEPQDRGARPGGRACPPPSWLARDSSGPTLLLRGLLLVNKKSSKIGMSIELRSVFLFCKTQK